MMHTTSSRFGVSRYLVVITNYYKQVINAIVSGSYFNGHLVVLNDSHNVCNSKWTRTTKRHLIEIGVI